MRIRVLLIAVAFISAGRAAILYNTLSDPNVGNRAVLASAQYQSFSTGAGLSALTDVQLRLQGNNNDSGSVSVDLFSDLSTSPGAFLVHIGSLSDTSLLFNSSAAFDFPVSSFTLGAATRYWIGLSTANQSSADWILGLTGSGDVGTTGQFLDDTGTVSSDSFINFEAMVTVGSPLSSTPEPAGLSLAAIGLCAIMARAMFRNAKRARG